MKDGGPDQWTRPVVHSLLSLALTWDFEHRTFAVGPDYSIEKYFACA
jgi:hypothetical protein